jgi:hypothetical protein
VKKIKDITFDTPPILLPWWILFVYQWLKICKTRYIRVLVNR